MQPFIQDELYLTYGREAQLDFVPAFHKLAYEQFEGRIRIHSATNTRASGNLDAGKAQRRGQALGRHHGSADAQIRGGHLQVGHHPLSDRRLRGRKPA